MATYAEPVYNEPLAYRVGDVIPEYDAPSERSFSSVVKARLELEVLLGACDVAEEPESLSFSPAHDVALAAILTEADSPTSAALRAEAALVACATSDPDVAGLVRELALDPQIDLETRVNAVGSVVRLADASSVSDIDELLSDKDAHIRRTAYLGALRSDVSAIVEHATARFKKQRNAGIAAAVTALVPRMQEGTTVEARRSS